MDILPLLADKGVLSKERVAGLETALKKPDSPSVETLLQKEGVTLPDILKAKSDYYGVPAREVGESSVPFDILGFVPEESARHYRLFPLPGQERALEAGIIGPAKLEAGVALP